MQAADVFTPVAITSAAVAATSVVVVEETEPFTATLTLATVLTLAHRRAAAVVLAVVSVVVAEAVVALEADSVVVHALAVAAEEAVLEVADNLELRIKNLEIFSHYEEDDFGSYCYGHGIASSCTGYI